MHAQSYIRACAVLGLLVAGSCDDRPTPSSLVAVSNTSQTAIVGAAVAQRPSVKVLDNKGNPYPGFPVSFTVSSGGGTLASRTDTSDVDGIAVAGDWVIGTVAGPNVVSATAAGLAGSPLTFTANGTPSSPARIQAVAGLFQSSVAGTVLPIAPVVRVSDEFGNPVPSVPVTFQITIGGGSVNPPSAATNASGEASAQWTLGTVAGPNAMEASTPGREGPMRSTYNASGNPGSPTKVFVLRQPSGSASGSLIVKQPILRIADNNGNAIPGATNAVTVSVATGSAVLSGTITVPAVNGVVTFTDLVLTGPGPVSLAFTATGLATTTSQTFTVQPPVGPPAKLGIDVEPSGAVWGSAFTIQPVIHIQDVNGSLVTTAATDVSAAIETGPGTLIGITTVPAANGIATFSNLRIDGAGTFTLRFTAPGLAAATSTIAVSNPPASAILLSSGNQQSVMAGGAVTTNPTVRIIGRNGDFIAGAKVTFTASLGGGVVTGGTAVSDANGFATVGSWTLGPGFNTLTAVAEGSPVTGNPIVFTASGCTGEGPGFRITLCFTTDMTPSQKSAFANAAARWEAVIAGDLPDEVIIPAIPAGTCGEKTHELSAGRTIDDLLIFASIVPIDGPSGILGSAGPCFVRGEGPNISVGDFSVVGVMRFDAADMASMEANGIMNAVITHEMGHVIGIGSLWEPLGLLKNPSSASVVQDTYFSGANALAAFNSIGFATYTGNKVPVENAGGAGTINSHWRESVLHTELMTGFVSPGANPLSLLSVRSLQDLGYSVNIAAADPFSSGAAPTGGPLVRVPLGDDLFRGPFYFIGRSGRHIRIR